MNNHPANNIVVKTLTDLPPETAEYFKTHYDDEQIEMLLESSPDAARTLLAIHVTSLGRYFPAQDPTSHATCGVMSLMNTRPCEILTQRADAGRRSPYRHRQSHYVRRLLSTFLTPAGDRPPGSYLNWWTKEVADKSSLLAAMSLLAVSVTFLGRTQGAISHNTCGAMAISYSVGLCMTAGAWGCNPHIHFTKGKPTTGKVCLTYYKMKEIIEVYCIQKQDAHLSESRICLSKSRTQLSEKVPRVSKSRIHLSESRTERTLQHG